MPRAVCAASVVLAMMALTGAAGAQETKDDNGKTFFDVVKPDDLRLYCIYRGEAYSTGAFMCEARQANVCAGPDEPPAGGAKPPGRAYWRSLPADKICGTAE